MFTNVGGKIKTLAKVICWIFIVISILIGIAGIIFAISMASQHAPTGTVIAIIIGSIVYAAIGVFVAWISSFMLLGYGQMIQNTDKIVDMLEAKNGTSAPVNSSAAYAPYTAPKAPKASRNAEPTPQYGTFSRPASQSQAAPAPAPAQGGNICPDCGTKGNPGDIFCKNCGHSFK